MLNINFHQFHIPERLLATDVPPLPASLVLQSCHEQAAWPPRKRLGALTARCGGCGLEGEDTEFARASVLASIARAVYTSDAQLASTLLRHQPKAQRHMIIEVGNPQLKKPFFCAQPHRDSYGAYLFLRGGAPSSSNK